MCWAFVLKVPCFDWRWVGQFFYNQLTRTIHFALMADTHHPLCFDGLGNLAHCTHHTCHIPPALALRAEPCTSPPALALRAEPCTSPPALALRAEPCTSPPAGVAMQWTNHGLDRMMQRYMQLGDTIMSYQGLNPYMNGPVYE